MHITKLVTQDIYGNTHIYRDNRRPYTYSDKVSCKCSKCGKNISKTFSFEYYDTPTQEQIDYLKERKEKWLAEEHVCNKCLKEACKAEKKVIDTTQIECWIDCIKNREKMRADLRKEINIFCNCIDEELAGKVCLYDNKEFLIEYVHFDNCYGSYYIEGRKIDERNPWSTTYKNIYITEEGKGFGGSDSVSAKFSEVQFTDEVFVDRMKRVKELEE